MAEREGVILNQVVQAVDVTKVFDGKVAVDKVNMTVSEGSIHGVVGANGAGKSTLLRMLIGLMEPTNGRIEVFGEPVHNEARSVRERLHYVGADGDLYRSFRVADLIDYGRYAYPKWDDKRSQLLLEALQLPLRRPIRNLSLGMKMQLRLLVALSSRPELLILDEPTNGLDPVVKRQFLQLIVQEVANTGMTVLFATHQLEELERIADAVTVMYNGRVLISGGLDHLKNHVKRVQAVLPEGLPEVLRQIPEVSRVERSGQLYTFVIEGGIEPSIILVEKLRAIGATYTEVVDVGFDELFRYTMQKEGYT
jgi:ABC-2 type transport system ATP-binding protein